MLCNWPLVLQEAQNQKPIWEPSSNTDHGQAFFSTLWALVSSVVSEVNCEGPSSEDLCPLLPPYFVTYSPSYRHRHAVGR